MYRFRLSREASMERVPSLFMPLAPSSCGICGSPLYRAANAIEGRFFQTMNYHESDRSQRRLPLRLRRRRYNETELLRRHLRNRRPSTGAHSQTNGSGADAESTALVERAREQMLRLQAEFDNYRRRSKKEADELRETANANLVKEFLPILDNFSRALQNPGNSLEGFVDGIKMVSNLFTQTLKSAGLERIEAVGQPFDPNFHEAVLVDNSGEHPENHVVEVLQEGFVLKGKLIRPAMVKVARKG